MSFVVSPAVRVVNPTDPSKFTVKWGVVFEDASTGLSTGSVADRTDRGRAQEVADALNAAASTAPDTVEVAAPAAPAAAPAAPAATAAK